MNVLIIEDLKQGIPQISVITPAYNAERFIKKTVDSVLAQSISNWELIVIDDASTDDTQRIVAEYAKRDPRIRLIVNENNMGVARTRNRGLELFRGEYVAFLDSDDYWESCMLEKMVERAQETKADIIYCSYALVDESGRKVCNDFIVPAQTTFKDSIVRSVITCSTVLITAELARNNRFPTDVYHEDIAMWFRILKDGGTACGVTEVLASYCQRTDSRSADKLISACRRWPIYRKYLHMSMPETLVTMLRYGYYGVLKFKRI